MSLNINNVAASVGLNKLPSPALRYLASFLSYSEQGNLAQVCTVARDAARVTEQNLVGSTAPLRKGIELLSQGTPITDRLLVALATSRVIGHPRHWVPHMEAALKQLIPDRQVKTIIEGHAKLANALAASETPISSAQMYQFCRYLWMNDLARCRLWAGYRALESYLLQPKLPREGVNKALNEYLTTAATNKVYVSDHQFCELPERLLYFYEVDIDPRRWFGFDDEESSLWVKRGAQNGEIPPMPKPICEVLWTRIQTLQATCTDRPFSVCMVRRAEAGFPQNFTLPLAELITSAGMFLEHENTIDVEKLAHPEYACLIRRLSEIEKEALAKKYPTAVQRRRPD